MTLEELKQVQKAAHAAWVKSPTKANEAALAEATRSVAAAKKAAAPVVAVDNAAIDAAINAAKNAEQERTNLVQLKRAYAIYEAAHDFPRCGEGWPNSAAERSADKLLKEANVSLY